jgi:demethylmenaquinone methyltransferase/2-methoxy-6-polyprenyl-1,4-benzoquinol methylase
VTQTPKTTGGEQERPGRKVTFGFKDVGTDEKKRLVNREFDSIARRYDLANALLSFGLHFLWKKTAIRMLGLRRGDRVLDLCGGTADLALLAAKETGPEGMVVVYDMNRPMMDVGKEKAVKNRLDERIDYVQGDAEKIGHCDAAFDAVMAGFGVRNLAHLEDGLTEACRVLRPGGKFMCLEFSLPTTALLRWAYDLYSFKVMPAAGRLITGNGGAFAYLAESIRVFPSADGLVEIMRAKGFSKVTYRRLTNGIAAVHLAEK